MLVRIERRQFLDPKQGRKKQRLEATTQRLLTVMQQGKIVVEMGALIGLDGLLELDHHWAKGITVVEPVGKEMHTHKRQTGRDLDDLRPTGAQRTARRLARAPLEPIELPLRPPPV